MRVHAARVDAEMPAQKRSKTGGVQDRPRTNHAPGRKRRRRERRPRQHVHRVRGHQQDGVGRARDHLRNDLTKNRGVSTQQLQSCLAGPLIGTGREDHDRRAVDIFVAAGPHAHRIRERHGVHQIHRLALCTLRIEIDQHDLGSETAQKQGVCGGGADMSRADDRDSMWMAHFTRTCGRLQADSEVRLKPDTTSFLKNCPSNGRADGQAIAGWSCRSGGLFADSPVRAGSGGVRTRNALTGTTCKFRTTVRQQRRFKTHFIEQSVASELQNLQFIPRTHL
jgi:hypothetical protein